MRSHVDCFTLDHFAEVARSLMVGMRARGHRGGFGAVVFDHDKAYRRVRRARRFRCIVPVISPGGVIVQDGVETFVEAGRIIFLEMFRLLFGEAAAVAAYCLVARTIALLCCKVLDIPVGHYIDNFGAVYALLDRTAADDLREFVVEVLRVHLQDDKFKTGSCLVYLGVEVRLTCTEITFCLTENRRAKYLAVLQRFLESGVLHPRDAREWGGRLGWLLHHLRPLRPRLPVPHHPTGRAAERRQLAQRLLARLLAVVGGLLGLTGARLDAGRACADAQPPGTGAGLHRCQHGVGPRGGSLLPR